MSTAAKPIHTDPSTASMRPVALQAKKASRALAKLTEDQRNAALHAIATALQHAQQAILSANAEDMRAATSLRGDDALAPSTTARLELNPARLQQMIEQVLSVAALPDPLGRVLDAIELDAADPQLAGPPNAQGTTEHGLHLQKISVPLGLLAVIFEARPDAVTQIAALALKSGNAVLLKPGREVEHTAQALVAVLHSALKQHNLPEDAISLVTGREQMHELLQAHDLIDMVIPRGSKALVDYVQANTKIPVLGHSEGICHIYVDRAADADLALRIIADAKLDYPAACNAVETVLIHREIAPHLLPQLAADLQSKGIRLHGDPDVRNLLANVPIEPVRDWHTEFGEPELAIGLVDSLDAAIDHIHTHGSGHTESILTQDTAAAERFLREVDAAGVFHNASTRFADGFRYGFGAEVGVSTSKFHARGPVGLEGLTTYKYILRGRGHIAGDYRGPHARQFTHKREPQ